jgi:hypothetical protein
VQIDARQIDAKESDGADSDAARGDERVSKTADGTGSKGISPSGSGVPEVRQWTVESMGGSPG